MSTVKIQKYNVVSIILKDVVMKSWLEALESMKLEVEDETSDKHPVKKVFRRKHNAIKISKKSY